MTHIVALCFQLLQEDSPERCNQGLAESSEVRIKAMIRVRIHVGKACCRHGSFTK